MKPFGLKYLEVMQQDQIVTPDEWSWKPCSDKPIRVYASGNSTRSKESTYANERDNRPDEDRPNEGLAA